MTSQKLLSFTKPTPDFSRKFFDLYTQKSMVDVTLSADGQFLYAHKVVLAVASSWFEVSKKNCFFWISSYFSRSWDTKWLDLRDFMQSGLWDFLQSSL